MWCIYFFMLVIYCVAVTVAYGIKAQIRVDYYNLSICLRLYVFDWIEIFSIKSFVCDNGFYYSVNRGEIKAIKARSGQNKGKSGECRKRISKTDYYGLISQIISDMPQFKIKGLKIMHSLDLDDEMQRVLFDNSLGIVVSVFKAVVYDKIKFKNLSVEDIRQSTEMRGVIMECTLNFVVFKILFYLLHILALKRKYTSYGYN